MIPNRVIIDTNVLLDLFVFDDPRWHGLRAALEDGSIETCTRADCCKEWHIVLTYPHLPLTDSTREIARQHFDRLLPLWTGDPIDTPLPLCKDRDDQKFLELARDANASILITKDKALLKLAKKTQRTGLFRIMTPEVWHKEQESQQQASKADRPHPADEQSEVAWFKRPPTSKAKSNG